MDHQFKGLGVDKDGRGNTMKTLQIPLVIVLVVLAGRTFDAHAQTVTILHSFGSYPADGGYPYDGLVQGSDGNFYGTTFEGGTNGGGAVVRISPGGSYTNLHSFASLASVPNDGVTPMAGLVQGTDGNFYGTTIYGGPNTNCQHGCGTVFRISPSGSYTSLFSFGSSSVGQWPYGGLVQGSDGNFYGTTRQGGLGYGTVFRISPSGSETNLLAFGVGPADGDLPVANLVRGSDGNFFGTTVGGGTNADGNVFRIGPSGNYTDLHSFTGYPNDGNSPVGLVHGSDGNFYGTTAAGGTGTNCFGGGCGTVFRISPSGSETNLYSFVS